MSKIWAICSGCDWYDASVDHVIIPEGMNLEQEEKERDRAVREWHKRKCDRLPTGEWPGTFVEWLVAKGAIEPSDDILEEYWRC